MKKIFLLIMFTVLHCLPVFSVEADDSINDIILQKYNSSEHSLPKLPQTSPKSVKSRNFLDVGDSSDNSSGETKKDISPSYENIPKVPQKVSNAKTFKVNKWRKVNAKLLTPVSDVSKTGKQISFVTLEPLYSKSFVIPKGSTIYGTVINSHSPQILGNGGLVSIKTDYISYNGKKSYFDANVVNVNHKHVFFNNIKGKNGYLKGVSKAMKPGKTFYKKSVKWTKKVWNSPFGILSPVVFLPGAVFILADGAISPFIAVFSKGDKIYIKRDSTVTLKLKNSAYIEY